MSCRCSQSLSANFLIFIWLLFLVEAKIRKFIAFCKAYEETGLKLYAISPSNEPGYEAPWNSCKWTSQQMGTFLTGYLEPAMKKSCPDIRIIYGENLSWSDPEHPQLQFLSSQRFVEEILAEYPTMDGDTYIALEQYVTTEHQNWEKTEFKYQGKGYSLLIQPRSVTSLVGFIK